MKSTVGRERKAVVVVVVRERALRKAQAAAVGFADRRNGDVK